MMALLTAFPDTSQKAMHPEAIKTRDFPAY
jgi:hypothetical protein